jgi:hypothetical protein
MKAGNKIAVISSALLLLACGFLYSGKTVSAGAEGKITGTVKLDGVAPYMRGIDMSKDPFCSQAHAKRSRTSGNRGGWSERGLGERGSLHLRGTDRERVDGRTNVSAGIRSNRIAEILGDRKHAQPRKNSH